MKTTMFKDCKAYCPICCVELERMVPVGISSFETESSKFHAGLDHLEYRSEDEHSKFCRTGNFYFCPNCKELIFAYGEQDNRICGNCPHRGDVEYKDRVTEKIKTCKGCTWFNVSFGTSHRLGCYREEWRNIHEMMETRHCTHIDDDKKELDPRMQCFLCKFYHKSMMTNEYACLASEPYHIANQRALETQVGICQEFKLDYEAYKRYRSQFEGLLLIPDDAITIPEFDERIRQEESSNE